MPEVVGSSPVARRASWDIQGPERATGPSVDPLDVVAWAGLEHPPDEVVGQGRRWSRRIVDRRADLAKPALHPGWRIDGEHPRGVRALVSVRVPRAAWDEDRLTEGHESGLLAR